MFSKFKLLSLYFLFSLVGTTFARGRLRDSYQHFFPDVQTEVTKVLGQNCSSLFESYREEQVTLYGTYCVKTYSCILQNLSEYTKANMASATVLLGLTPWILSTMGSTTIEMSLLSSRRPLLAALLVLGSPTMKPTRPFEYYNPFADQLALGKGQWAPSKVTGTRRFIFVLLEFLVASGSIANLATMSWTLGLNTIAVISCDDSDSLVELWIALAIFAHLFGIITFFSRAEIHTDRRERASISVFQKARDWLSLIWEFKLCVNQKPLNVTWGEENWKFAFWSWFAAGYTVAHLLFGTLVFSSLSFVGQCSRASNILRMKS